MCWGWNVKAFLYVGGLIGLASAQIYSPQIGIALLSPDKDCFLAIMPYQFDISFSIATYSAEKEI